MKIAKYLKLLNGGLLILLTNMSLAQNLPFYNPSFNQLKRVERKVERLNETSTKLLKKMEAGKECLNPAPQVQIPPSSIESQYQSLLENQDFLMTQPQVAEWAEIFRGIVQDYETYSSTYNKLSTTTLCNDSTLKSKDLRIFGKQYKEASDGLKQLLSHEQKKISKYLERNPLAQQVFQHQKELKKIEHIQQPFSNLQTKDLFLENLAQQLGTSPEQALNKIQQKLASTAAQITQEQEEVSKHLASDQLKQKSWSQRIKPSFDLSFNGSSPSSIDALANLTYQINTRLDAGIGMSQRIELGTDWNNIHLQPKGRGVRTLASYNFWKGFFFQTSHELYRIPETVNNDALNNPNSWQKAFLVGLGSTQDIGRKSILHTTILYRVNSDVKSQFPNRFIIRIGIQKK